MRVANPHGVEAFQFALGCVKPEMRLKRIRFQVSQNFGKVVFVFRMGSRNLTMRWSKWLVVTSAYIKPQGRVHQSVSVPSYAVRAHLSDL